MVGKSVQLKAGINFPVIRMKKFMEKLKANKNVNKQAAIFLAAELEYLTAEIADLASQACEQEKKQTIKATHLFKAIDGDDEIRRVLGKGIIHEGGTRQTVFDFKQKTQKQVNDAAKMAKLAKDEENIATMGA